MDAVVVLTLFCLLPLLAARWGVDSREPFRSQEHELAGRGFRWG